MLKKIILPFILIVIVLIVCIQNENKPDLYKSIIKRGQLTVGISCDSKPFGYRDKNERIYGVDPDIAREIARRIFGNSKKIIFKQIASKDRINAVVSGDVDVVISSMTITPQRQDIIAFSDPYFVDGQAICVKKYSNIDSCLDLNKKKVIVVYGTTGEENIKYFAPQAFVQGYISNADAFNAFRHGEGDAITTDESLLSVFVANHDGYEILPGRLTEEPYGIAFRKSKETDLLKKNIDKILNDMRVDGTLNIIKKKWGIA